MRSIVACIAVQLVLLPAAWAQAQDVQTQIVRDGSIGPDRSVQPTPASRPEGGASYEIGDDLGARSADGATLFHSFESFNVGSQDAVLFTTEVPTRTLITRVTGGVRSDIFGSVETKGPASSAAPTELFFLNPAGILFGRGSKLGGQFSFIASTAEELTFADGSTFRIDTEVGSPVLVVDPSTVGEVSELSFGSVGAIRVEGATINSGVLGLVTGGPGTRISVQRPTERSFAGPHLDGFSIIPSREGFVSDSALLLDDVVLSGREGRASKAFFITDGAIDIQNTRLFSPGELELSLMGGELFALAGGPLRVRGSKLGAVLSFASLSIPVLGSRSELHGSLIEIERSVFLADDQLRLTADKSLRIGDSELSSPNAGVVHLMSEGSVTLDRTSISAADIPIFGLLGGSGGTIEIDSPLVDISNGSFVAASSGAVFSDAASGTIRINGDRIRVSGGSTLSTRIGALTGARAGAILIRGGAIEIADGSSLLSLVSAGFVATSDTPGTQVTAGAILLDGTRSVRVTDSRVDTRLIATSTEGFFLGTAGNITLQSSGDVILKGSSLTSSSGGTGDSGSISVSGARVALDSASILSSNEGLGRAGSVRVDSTTLELSGSSQIATDARRGPPRQEPAGNISLDIRDTLLIRDGSAVTASVDEGQGGDIRIASPRSVIVRDDSEILAETALGTGGRIDITTNAFLVDSSSRVSADAAVGTSGSVEIMSPEVDLQGGLEDLSTEFLNASALLRPSCEAREASGSTASFYVPRGLPPSPEEWLLALDASPRDVGAGSEEGVSSLIATARSQQAVGAYTQSLATLERALLQAEESGDRSGIATVLGASGNAQHAIGHSAAAESLLTRGVHLAKQQENVALASRIENDLANYYAAAGATAPARQSYRLAIDQAERSGDALATVKALANAARLALASGNGSEAQQLLKRAYARLSELPDDRAKVSVLIHLGRSNAELAARLSGDEHAPALMTAHALLQSAADLSHAFDDPRLRSYALGNIGRLYWSEHRFDEALALTRAAQQAAERSGAYDALYGWHWQEGQLLWALGKANGAVHAYRRAVEILGATRHESRAQYGAASFARAFEPIYLDLVDALLRGADAIQDAAAIEALLLEARATVENLKAAELLNYLRDDCASQLESRTVSLDSLANDAAVIYPIALSDRLELLVRLPDGLQRYTVRVPSNRIESEAKQLRVLLQDRTSTSYRPIAQRLYDWLVRPYAARLSARGVQTLVFVPSGALRTVPMAALHDGERFLAERFGIAAAPGLSLVDARPLDLARVKPLLGGVSEAVQEFAALGQVPSEIAAIRDLFGGEVLLDEAFQTERIQTAIQESRPTLVHFASHAVFTGDPQTSFVLTHDGRMTMGELASVLSRTRFREDPIELLVLSACDTAVGDERAALGLAGVAVRSGARSALGSLWAISDEATYPLIKSFYAKLREPGTSRAAALRHAQRELLASEEFAHPFYWSTFVLISNWL